MDDGITDQERAAFYKSHRDHHATSFKKKHRRQYDHEFVGLTGANSSMAVLEVGCGTGIFLRYLEACGYEDIVGIDMDENLSDALADLSRSEVYLKDVMTILKTDLAGRTFDRIVMLDVAEHLQLPVLVDLMKTLREHLNRDGRLLLRVPNIESPWGLKMFFGTFDHVTPLGRGRLYELGIMTGWACEGCFVQYPGKWTRRLKDVIVNSTLGGRSQKLLTWSLMSPIRVTSRRCFSSCSI